jgi:FKBP-type peptidyl-prolyl cis-trans isomerase
MKNLLVYSLLTAFVLTGCINSPGNPYGEPVDETDFLEENAQKEGVTVTESGLQYRVIEEGEGEPPFDGAVVFLEYTGTLINGDTFMQTSELDFFPLSDEIIAGVYEGVMLMSPGARYELVLPTELGFGNNPPPNSPIRPGSVLIFDITLDSYLQEPNEFLAENLEREDVFETESGLQYRIIEEGEGEDTPSASSSVLLEYEGRFSNGYVFDSGTLNNQLSTLISGFSEGVQLMNKGAVYELFVPANLGYQDNHPQYGNVLIFEIELTSFTD